MENIKVLMSSRPKLLSEVIQNLVMRQQDMEVVGEVLDPNVLMLHLRKYSVDVIIMTPLKGNGEPEICQRLLAEHPEIIIVTQSADGGWAYLYQANQTELRLPDSSGEAILIAIRQALSRI